MTESKRRRGRVQLLLIAALFIVPTLAAWWLIGTGWRPEGTTNRGELVQPPQPMAPERWRMADGEQLGEPWFHGRWTVLAVRETTCDAACREELDGALRARIALDRDAWRVTPLLLIPEGVTAPEDAPPALRVAFAPRAEIRRLMTDHPQGVTVNHAAYYLVDYRGFRMMAYSQPLEAADVLHDLEHLLRLADEDVERYERTRQAPN